MTDTYMYSTFSGFWFHYDFLFTRYSNFDMSFIFHRAQFFGDVSPKDNPVLYIQSIQKTLSVYKEHYRHQGPLIINTMGWVKGQLWGRNLDYCLLYYEF